MCELKLNNDMSLFIPFVYESVSDDKIVSVFSKYGDVGRIDRVSKVGKDEKKYTSVYIHYAEWDNTVESLNLQRDLLAKVRCVEYYCAKWYWIVLNNNVVSKVVEESSERLELELAPGLSSVLEGNMSNMSVSELVSDEKVESVVVPVVGLLKELDDNMMSEYEEDAIEMAMDDDEARLNDKLGLVSVDYVSLVIDENSRLRYEAQGASAYIGDMTTRLNAALEDIEMYKRLLKVQVK